VNISALSPKLTGCLAADVARYLRAHGCTTTAEHSWRVAVEASALAVRFGGAPQSAEAAAQLHDVSAVIPVSERIEMARVWDLFVLPEEEKAPMILHQKLSTEMSRRLFGVRDRRVLSAVGCHTTLKPQATVLDKAVFLADKIAWDQSGEPPYMDAVIGALSRSLDAGVCAYLAHLWNRRATLPVLHPWLVAAFKSLCNHDIDSACGPRRTSGVDRRPR
jgi:predicted HD superfamily hydrolase involved in NAD metabolism